MPNHVTHRMTVTGSKAAIDSFVQRFCATSDDGSLILDFRAVIPMPGIIAETEESSDVTNGLLLLGRGDLISNPFMSKTLDGMLEYTWVKAAGITDVDGLKSYFERERPGAIDKAKKAIAAHEQTGHTSWYDWSLANWGTKWDAYSAATSASATANWC